MFYEVYKMGMTIPYFTYYTDCGFPTHSCPCTKKKTGDQQKLSSAKKHPATE